MEALLIITLLVFCLMIFLIFRGISKIANRPKMLKKKIDEMGNPKGKDYNQIAACLGKPMGRTFTDAGYCVEWRETTNASYWITFRAFFDSQNICIDYECEYSGNVKW